MNLCYYSIEDLGSRECFYFQFFTILLRKKNQHISTGIDKEKTVLFYCSSVCCALYKSIAAELKIYGHYRDLNSSSPNPIFWRSNSEIIPVFVLLILCRDVFSPKMRTLLESGTTLIVDRYAYSGVSFTAAKEVREMNSWVVLLEQSSEWMWDRNFMPLTSTIGGRGRTYCFCPVCHSLFFNSVATCM